MPMQECVTRNDLWTFHFDFPGSLHADEGIDDRLRGNIDGVVGVGKAVELGGGALGVGTHVLKVEPVAHIDEVGEVGALGDAVDAVAGRAPDRVFDAIDCRAGEIGVVDSLAVAAQDLGNGVLVVKDDVGKVAVDAVVDVNHVRGGAGGRVINGAAGNDIAGNGKGRGDVVATRLSNDFNVSGSREELVEGATENSGVDFKGSTREATTDVERAQVKAVAGSLLEDDVGILDSVVISHGISRAGADVEADANDVEAELLGEAEKAIGGVHGGTKLHAEAAGGGCVVSDDAQVELGVGEVLGNLVELVGVVKGHLADAGGLDVANVRIGLARLGIDDAIGGAAQGEDLINLGLGSAVEAGAEGRKETKDHGVGVAFDS